MKNLKFYKLKKRIGALVLVTTMLGGLAVGLSACNKKEEIDPNIIAQIHDENGVESQILHYIEISEKLDKLNLENYVLGDEELIELGTPEEIEEQINNYDEKNVTNVRYLKMQEILVNEYIYKTGYKIAYKNAAAATKSYAAELYGMEDPDGLTMTYYNSHDYSFNKPYAESVGMEYKARYIPEKISIENEDIIKGVRAMANTQTNSDSNDADNSSYNADRNLEIKKALVVAEELSNIVEFEDLYDEDEASRIKR